MISCKQNGQITKDHFTGAGNMVEVGSGAKREIKDYKLTRYACYLTAQNGDGQSIVDHFGSVANMVEVGSGAKREIKDYKLTRYACYLTAQNGDPRKEEIAFAQNYFATQTRKFELVMQRKADFERVLER